LKRQIFLSFLVLFLSVIVLAVSYQDYVLFNRFDEAFEAGKLLKKNLLVVFTTPDCYYSHRLRTEVFSDESVASFLREHFIVSEVFPLDSLGGHFDFRVEEQRYSPQAPEYSFQELFNIFVVRGTPTLVFFSHSQKHIASFTGFVEADSFLLLLQAIQANASIQLEQPGIRFFVEINPDSFSGKISPDELTWISRVLKNTHQLTFDEFRQADPKSLDPLDYFFVSQTTSKELNRLLQNQFSMLQNVFLVEEPLSE